MPVKISIITPSFNQAQYIEQTIDSVLSQNYPHREYIIIDGGSTDGSVDIIKKYERHLKYWVSESDRGQSHAINKGLKIATGNAINWLNSDDYYEPNALNEVAGAFENPATLVFSAKSNIVRNEKVVYQSAGTDIYFENLNKTIGWARIDQPETFFRKEAYDRVGNLNESLSYLMDKEWWIRYLLVFGLSGIHKSDSRIVNFRLHASSKTVSQAKGFEEEALGLYHFIAQQAECTNEIELIRALSPSKQSTGKYEIPSVERSQAKSILNYFLLRKADEIYYLNFDFSLARRVLRAIDKNGLDGEDRSLHQKLSLRTMFPSWLIHLLRK